MIALLENEVEGFRELNAYRIKRVVELRDALAVELEGHSTLVYVWPSLPDGEVQERGLVRSLYTRIKRLMLANSPVILNDLELEFDAELVAHPRDRILGLEVIEGVER